MKCITLLLDGASDRSYKVLDYKTPLQYAQTPNLDILAKRGQCGLMTPLSEGIALGTDLAHFLLFGYTEKEYPNRSIIDVIGEGVDFSGEELFLRCSFATVTKENGYLLHSRFTPDFSDCEIKDVLPELELDINGYHFKCIHSYDSHGFVVVTGPNLSSKISDSDPFRTNVHVMCVEPFETDEKEVNTLADAINTYIKKSYDILNNHPINLKRAEGNQLVANMILTKWAGMYKDIESFEQRNGMTGLLIGQSKLLEGVSSYLDLKYQHYNTFKEAVELAISATEDYIHLHTKEPDTASHKKDPFLKVKSLEEVDALIKPLLDFEGLLIVTSDHSTPCSGHAIHSGESVAFMAIGDYIRRDDVAVFDEIACSKGSLRLKASDMMNYVINATDKSAMYHLRQGQVKRNYVINNINRLV